MELVFEHEDFRLLKSEHESESQKFMWVSYPGPGQKKSQVPLKLQRKKWNELLIQLYHKNFVIYKLSKLNKCGVNIHFFCQIFFPIIFIFYLQGQRWFFSRSTQCVHICIMASFFENKFKVFIATIDLQSYVSVESKFYACSDIT